MHERPKGTRLVYISERSQAGEVIRKGWR